MGLERQIMEKCSGQFGACSQRRSHWEVLLCVVWVERDDSGGSEENELKRERSGNSRVRF